MVKQIAADHFSKVVSRVNNAVQKFNGRNLPLIDEMTMVVITNETANPTNTAGRLERLLEATTNKLEWIIEKAPDLSHTVTQSEFELMKVRLGRLEHGELPFKVKKFHG